MWFERQIYRRDGETVRLADGEYEIEYGRGPEYLRKHTKLIVNGGKAAPVACTLERWIKPSSFGYYSGDTHIHAAGCAHYESPYEGVTPEVMFRQVQGEALDIGDVLTWAPGFYHQKQYFSGHVHHFHDQGTHPSQEVPNTPMFMTSIGSMLRYDIEVSGFPSSHCGHLVLLGLKDQMYPGTILLEQWPSWNLPILKWAKSQGAVTGYAHSAGGLTVDSTELPNYLMPRFDSSGANEYIADVTHENCIDFISGCDLWPFAELNIWYHTLNCGYRVAFAGETDFPCITDDNVGGGRSYVKLDASPVGDGGYQQWIEGVKHGRSYVGDGRSHLFDLSASNETTRSQDQMLNLHESGMVHIETTVCALLRSEPDNATKEIQKASPYDRPYWHLERARISSSQKVPVELIVNGVSVMRKEIIANGIPEKIKFDIPVDQSSWLALRILFSSNTNPVYVIVNERPIRSSKRSAEWCRKAVDVCWKQKVQRIRPSEQVKAKVTYDHARAAYDKILAESRSE